MRESAGMGKLLTSQIPTLFNLANMLTNILFGQKNRSMVEVVLYDVFDWVFCPLYCNIDPTKSLEIA